MAGKSDYLENAILNHIYGAQTYTPPATIYIALFVSPPTDAGVGSEITGDDLPRLAVANNTTNWPVTNNSQKANGVLLDWGTPEVDLGNCGGWATFDAAANGNMLHSGAIDNPQALWAGNPVQMAISALKMTED